MGSTVTVTLEVEADIPAGAPDNVVRTVTENSRTEIYDAGVRKGVEVFGAKIAMMMSRENARAHAYLDGF